MIPPVTDNTLNPPLAHWEKESPRYKKDLIIKCIAMTALGLLGAGTIACSMTFIAAPLAIKILFSVGIASLVLAAVLKVHQTVHPYYFNGYNNESHAKKSCKSISELHLATKDDYNDRELSETRYTALENYTTKRIKEWVRYGFIDEMSGKELNNLYRIHIGHRLKMAEVMEDKNNFNKDLLDSLLAQCKDIELKFDHLMSSFIIPNLPFLPND